ncbi:DNA-directed DNA polymerase, partial [Tanacetum coccineum]
GLKTKDPLRQVKHYLSIFDNIQADGATRDTSRLRFFHFSLKGKAAEWLDRIPTTQITTWDQLVSRFLDHFFPVGRTSALRDLILQFKQGDDEPIKGAWIRFQDLIKQVPHHGIQKWLLVQIFHDNISQDDRSHEADECKQLNPDKQVCLSGGDIYDDPSFLRFYQNDDTSPWGNNKRKEKGEDGPEWIVRSKVEDELANFMLEKKSYAKGIGNMLEKLEKAASLVKLSEECSAIIQRSLPQKEGDPGSFTLPWISKLKPTKMSIQLADRSIKYPIGVCENLLVKVGKFIFPIDFVILEIDEDELVPIILGRPFLATARDVIGVHEGNHDDTVNHDRKWTEEDEEEDSNKALAVSFYPRTEPVELLEWKALDNRLKPSSVEPPKLELKKLPEHLDYAFLQEDNQLLVVILATFVYYKKTRLLEVL